MAEYPEKIAAEDTYLIRLPCGASNFDLGGPALRNFEFFRGADNWRRQK